MAKKYKNRIERIKKKDIKYGLSYYYVIGFRIRKTIWMNSALDLVRFENKRAFKTKEDAEAFCHMRKNKLRMQKYYFKNDANEIKEKQIFLFNLF